MGVTFGGGGFIHTGAYVITSFLFNVEECGPSTFCFSSQQLLGSRLLPHFGSHEWRGCVQSRARLCVEVVRSFLPGTQLGVGLVVSSQVLEQGKTLDSVFCWNTGSLCGKREWFQVCSDLGVFVEWLSAGPVCRPHSEQVCVSCLGALSVDPRHVALLNVSSIGSSLVGQWVCVCSQIGPREDGDNYRWRRLWFLSI